MKLLILTISWREGIKAYYENTLLYKSLVETNSLSDQCVFKNIHFDTKTDEHQEYIRWIKTLFFNNNRRFKTTEKDYRWNLVLYKVFFAAQHINDVPEDFTHILYIDLDDTYCQRLINVEDFNVDHITFGWDPVSHPLKKRIHQWNVDRYFDVGGLSSGFILGPIALFKQMMKTLACDSLFDLYFASNSGRAGDELFYGYFFLKLYHNTPCQLDYQSFWVLNTLFKKRFQYALNGQKQIYHKQSSICPYFIHQACRSDRRVYQNFLGVMRNIEFPQDPAGLKN